MRVLAISGGTCSGKSTIERALVARGVRKVLSHTTRAPRPNEVHGVDYHFVTPAEFEALRLGGWMIETNAHAGAMYGTSAKSLASALLDSSVVVKVIEPTGLFNLSRYCWENGMSFTSIWLDAPLDQRITRFVKRGLPVNPESRLLAMAGQEEHQWVELTKYFDRVIRTSDSTSVDVVATQIMDFIEQQSPELDSHGL